MSEIGHKSICHISIKDYPGTVFLLSATLHDAISILSHGMVVVKIEQPLTSNFVGAQISIDWYAASEQQWWRGMILEISSKTQGIARLTVGSVLQRLTHIQESRHDVHSPVNTVLIDVLSRVYDRAQIVIETSNPLPERALIIHQEADLMSLVERLLHDYALFFYEIHDPDLSRLLICDKLKTEENPMQSRWTADERVVERYRYGKKGSVLELETECLDMKLGSVFTVQQDQYIVSAITHEFDESQHMILSSHARVKSRYRNTVLAQPINIPWQSSYVPRVSQATLRTAMIHRFDQGQYQLILESDRDKKNPKPTSPVPALTPYGGTEYGFHCPLHEDMQVLTLDRRGHPDEPLIMGALYQGREPHLNRLRTQAGHELLMDDTLNEESIRLSSAQESCYLHMEAKKSEELMTLCNQAGGIDIHAGATMTQYAGDTMMIETSSDLIMSSQGHLQISTEDSHIMMSAGAKIHMQAGASWHAQIGQDMKLDITGHYLHQSLGGYQLEVHEGDYTVRVEKGGLQWSAHSDLRVGTEHGDIHMDCGLSSLHILSSGEIKINANILKLVATQIEAPQAAFSINT